MKTNIDSHQLKLRFNTTLIQNEKKVVQVFKLRSKIGATVGQSYAARRFDQGTLNPQNLYELFL